jgi:hypothetical protein
LAPCGTGLNRPVDGALTAADPVLDLVADFCAHRGVAAGTRFSLVHNLGEAVRIVSLKGPDRRWQAINARGSTADAASAGAPSSDALVDRQILRRAVATELRDRSGVPRRGRTPGPWFLRHTVVSAAHFTRSSIAIRCAREQGLGWMVPANREVLVVKMPTVRLAEGRSDLLHDDTGAVAIKWPDGSGAHYLQGAWFDPVLYRRVIDHRLTLSEVAALPNADQRSVALTYLTFARLVGQSGALLIDRGVKSTRLYRLRLPASIARDRPGGYGEFDYFIHMHDASHPEREFIEWVDPAIGRRADAELCQAHAFGITRDQWLSITDEG